MPIKLVRSKEELRRFGRKTSDYPKLSLVGEIDIIPEPGLGAVSFAANIKSETDPSDFYRVRIRFLDVKFYNGKQANTVEVEYRGEKKYMLVPAVRVNDTQQKCACFTGDTLIPMADGTHKRIDELVGLEKFYVYSFNRETGEKVIGEGYNCEIKERNAELYEVEFDNGYKVKCTGDHEFLTKNGYVRADQLKPETSIETLYRKLSTNDEHYNHKIKSVKKLDERQDVYCFTVKQYNNFAISVEGNKNQSSGVFVHNCSDFRFNWEKQLYDKQALIGNWRRYKRKTPPSVRPAKPKNPNPIGHDFKNPDNYKGFCKHLWSLLNILKDKGLVRERAR